MPRLIPLIQKLLLAAALIVAIAAPLQAEPITLTSDRIEYFHIGSSDNRAGKLVFAGGLEIYSDDERFGGLSGLRISSDGRRLNAVSDTAYWLAADIKRNGKGAISGLSDAALFCLCRQDGTRYGSKHWGDSEGLEIDGGTAYVSFERLNRINRYQLGKDGSPGAPVQATVSFKPFNVAYNEGLEAVALAPAGSPVAGRFIAIAEESLNVAGDNRAFVASKSGIEEFAITRSDGYSITDAVFLPDGDLAVLERRFGLSVGIGMRIRRFDATSVKPGVTLKGEVLAEAGLSSRIDNMEGIAAWKDGDGRTRIVLISDDNFNRRLQRTLLLEFVLDE
ncbi:MAG: esterase-like activity of phytase family protein [Nitratireductor sp.]|nr:esterase-like activity of phytase family protein [Nitratireductor sp.]